MSFMEWNSLLYVNVESIDKEHETLVLLLNEMYNAIYSGKGKDVVGSTLDNLIEYTQTHFAHEEGLMKENNYYNYKGHKLEHDKLTSQVMEFQKKLHEGQEGVHLKVMNFLKEWLTDHIFGTDMKLGYFLSKK